MGQENEGLIISTTRFHLPVTPKQHQNPCSNTGSPSSTCRHNVGRQEIENRIALASAVFSYSIAREPAVIALDLSFTGRLLRS